MTAFRFRLEKVLEWYTHQFEAEERRFISCLAALADARKAIAALQAERLSIEHDVIARSAIPASDFVALGLYRLGARTRELELNALRESCEAKVEAQRIVLQTAQQRVRLLEKLRERRTAEHLYAESREIEELASDAFFAKWAAR